MDFHEYSLGNVNGIRLGLVSTMALTGFIGIIILPFYVYLFGTGIFWEFFGIIVSVLVVSVIASYLLMHFGYTITEQKHLCGNNNSVDYHIWSFVKRNSNHFKCYDWIR